VTVVIVLVLIGVGVLAYGWLEAGWLRTRVLDVSIAGLPEALDGLRIGHLSDFHLGARFSRGNRAAVAAVEWVASRRPDLVCVTGDLLSHPRGERTLRSLVPDLGRPFVVLGNHDVAVTRDPFSRAAELRDLEHAVLLRDEAEIVKVRGETVRVVGVDPTSYGGGESEPHLVGRTGAGLSLLLCHFPGIVRRIPTRSFDLILSGHLHAGQICLPLGTRRRITLAHPRSHYVAGLYETGAGTMHVSPGVGTTFVPFRFFARPEATELVLRRARQATA
jgi:predicted MPP superfamily phosphohydrolase